MISKCNYVSLKYPCFGEKLIVKGSTLIITNPSQTMLRHNITLKIIFFYTNYGNNQDYMYVSCVYTHKETAHATSLSFPDHLQVPKIFSLISTNTLLWLCLFVVFCPFISGHTLLPLRMVPFKFKHTCHVFVSGNKCIVSRIFRQINWNSSLENITFDNANANKRGCSFFASILLSFIPGNPC